MAVDRLIFLDSSAVHAALSYEAAIPIVREAMIALSAGRVQQLLRSFIPLGPGRTFAMMPAALTDSGRFGAKLLGIFQLPDRKTHQGVVVLFDETGVPVCIADAGAVTVIRTAAASAVATHALARTGAAVLAIFGTGVQAKAHWEAIRLVRAIKEVRVWGRDPAKAAAFAREIGAVSGEAREVVRGADIVCTVTGAKDPVLFGEWVKPGTHINVVGSSGPMHAEVDSVLVARCRFVADHREHALAHGGEFVRAKSAGLVGDDHIAGEIGEVLSGRVAARRTDEEITLYKSLGHAAQDLAVTAWLHERATRFSA